MDDSATSSHRNTTCPIETVIVVDYGVYEIRDAYAHAEAGGLNGKVVLHF